MAREADEKIFDFHGDTLDSYTESGVGVIHFKDKVFEMSVDFALQSILFERIKIAAESKEIKVLLMISGHSAVGEEKNYRFLKGVVDSRDGVENSDFQADIDPVMALSRVDSTLNQFILTMLQYNKFVISAVRGSVVTEFLGTILAADYRIASEDTVFSFPHLKWGLPPRGATGYLLPRYLGFAKAKELLLRGKPVDAPTAKQINLLDIIIPAESFEERCLEIAKGFTDIPSNVISMTKKLFASNIKELEEYLRLESELTNVYQLKLPPELNNE
ncbi:MAG: enoyl-CoA hydratase/isomerase family protein [candidate division Zixibacteria bacterium]